MQLFSASFEKSCLKSSHIINEIVDFIMFLHNAEKKRPERVILQYAMDLNYAQWIDNNKPYSKISIFSLITSTLSIKIHCAKGWSPSTKA